MTTLQRLMNWYESNCDGDWEHSFGVRISTLDNPGWRIQVSLSKTPLENRDFDSIREDRSDHDWIFCRVEDEDGRRFPAYGGVKNLEELILIFLGWADSAGETADTSPALDR
jgi:hypothetical protein